MNNDPSSRFRGCLLGLAVGDALGAPVEFKTAGDFEPITGMRSGGFFNLGAGQWTDDTSMALCIAASLIEKRSFDPLDQLDRFVRWYRGGYMSSSETCFDIGDRTRLAVEDYEKNHQPFRAPGLISVPSNGSIMRLAPIPMAYVRRPELAAAYAGDSSRLTHNHPDCVDACRYLGTLIAGALQGASKSELLSPFYSPVSGYWEQAPLTQAVAEVAGGSYKQKEPPQISADPIAALCLEAALWAFHKTDNYADGALLAVNLGNDSDTTGAVYGQLAGAYYGIESIPAEWLNDLYKKPILYELADGLLELSKVV